MMHVSIGYNDYLIDDHFEATKEEPSTLCGILDDVRSGNYENAIEAFYYKKNIPEKHKNYMTEKIGPSAHNGFEGWPEFDLFLESMKTVAKQLRKLGY